MMQGGLHNFPVDLVTVYRQGRSQICKSEVPWCCEQFYIYSPGVAY